MYTRFFGHKSTITGEELKRVTEADFVFDVALMAKIGSGDEEIVIGGNKLLGSAHPIAAECR